MWIPKWQRDRKKGIDSPLPTQVVSNEEFIPRPQNTKQKQVEHLISVLGEEKAKKLGMGRREFMASSMGIATAFMASNMVYGKFWDVEEIETLEPAAHDEKWPKGEYFVIDVQSHFTNGFALGFRNMEFVKNMGFKLKNDPDAYSFPNFVKEMFFDSETSMLVISGVPGKEMNARARRQGPGREGAHARASRQGAAQLGHVGPKERDQRAGRLPEGSVPGELRAQSLLGQES